MYLAVICGDKHNFLREKLVSGIDNARIDSFATIEDMVKSQSLRQYRYDRVLLTSQVIKRNAQSSVMALHSYNKKYCPNADIIMIARESYDAELAQYFAGVFNSAVNVTVLISQATVPILRDLATNNLNVISQSYSIVSNVQAEAEVDEYHIEDSNKNVPEKKSGGLFNRLFKGKGKDEPKNEKVKEESKPVESKSNKLGKFFKKAKGEEEMDSTEVENVSEEFEEIQPTYDNNTIELEEETFYETENEVDEDNYEFGDENTLEQNEEYEDEEEIEDIDNDTAMSIHADESAEDFKNQFNQSNEIGQSYEDYDDDSDNNGTNVIDNNNNINNHNSDDNLEGDNVFEGNNQEFDTEFEVEDVDTTPDFEVDTDLGVANGEMNYNSENLKVINDEDVKAIGDLEEKYREQSRDVKVVEKVVHVGKSSDVVENIIKGKSSRVILVTGDRGSGVTSMAHEIARFFAEKVPTLLVDGDLATHGVLNYLSYNRVRNYDKQQLQGTKLCKSASAFEHCALKYDTNLDLLLSDYFVEVSDDEFITTQATVAEISTHYNVVVVDVPFKYLHLCEDLVLIGVPVVCLEASKRGFMNTLYYLDSIDVKKRYKRTIQNKGSFVLTKVNPKLRLDDLKESVSNSVEFDEINWLSMPLVTRDKKITKEFLNKILEG